MNSDYDDWLHDETRDRTEEEAWLPLGCWSIFACLCIFYGCILLFSTLAKILNSWLG